MGDLNAKFGEDEQGTTVDKYGLGSLFDRTETLIHFCKENGVYYQ